MKRRSPQRPIIKINSLYLCLFYPRRKEKIKIINLSNIMNSVEREEITLKKAGGILMTVSDAMQYAPNNSDHYTMAVCMAEDIVSNTAVMLEILKDNIQSFTSRAQGYREHEMRYEMNKSPMGESESTIKPDGILKKRLRIHLRYAG